LTAEPLGAGRRALSGSVDQVRDDIRRYEAAGVTELFLDPNFQPGGAEVSSVLAQMTALAP
jgi:alkanesulfonate monooxygenase SsuD/methylene tetrahydromethanopterin reductase-like flavin-dependent oxidoreductase (luciferase family)